MGVRRILVSAGLLEHTLCQGTGDSRPLDPLPPDGVVVGAGVWSSAFDEESGRDVVLELYILISSAEWEGEDNAAEVPVWRPRFEAIHIDEDRIEGR